MALLDFLKRKKDVEKSKEKKPEKVSVTEKPKKVESVKQKKESESNIQKGGKRKEGSFSYEVVREPHISEKSTILNENNKYVFKIQSKTNKPEIKKAVEGIYGVDVLNVNIIQIPRKKRRIGRTEGFKKGYTKAVVTVKEGQKIEIF